jgi:hypothetical protein
VSRRSGKTALIAPVACAIGALLLVPAIGHAQTPQPVLDGIANQYRDASRLWRPRLVPIAQQLFMLLASIEFAVSGLVWALRHDRLDDIADPVRSVRGNSIGRSKPDTPELSARLFGIGVRYSDDAE